MEWAELCAEFQNQNDFLVWPLCGGDGGREPKVSLDERILLVGVHHQSLCVNSEGFTGSKIATAQLIDLCSDLK
jgi:hypothetical protein